MQLRFELDTIDYVNMIHQFPGYFDVIVIDGSHRKSCTQNSISRLNLGGILVIDNTDWHWYEKSSDLVPESWQKFAFSGWAPFIGHYR